MSKVSEQLLDAAEARIRTGGFHAVSFRDLAADLGIKSASVHYHFPKKEDLGVAVIERYATRFFDVFDERTGAGEDPVTVFIDLYRGALSSTRTACLCGVMGAETLGLPDPVRASLRAFLNRNVVTLAEVLTAAGRRDPEAMAQQAVAALQGAMMLSVNLQDQSTFETVATRVETDLRGA